MPAVSQHARGADSTSLRALITCIHSSEPPLLADSSREGVPGSLGGNLQREPEILGSSHSHGERSQAIDWCSLLSRQGVCMLMHAELLTFLSLNLCGRCVACCPPSSLHCPQQAGPHLLAILLPCPLGSGHRLRLHSAGFTLVSLGALSAQHSSMELSHRLCLTMNHTFDSLLL